MSINKFTSEFSNNIESIQLSENEERFIDLAYTDIKHELQEKHLFHVIKDVIGHDVSRGGIFAVSLGAIEKLCVRLKHDQEINLDPDLLARIKKVFIEKFVILHQLPEQTETADTDQLLDSIWKLDPWRLGTSFDNCLRSFLEALSLESQLEIIRLLIAKGESISLSRFDKIRTAPLGIRLQLALSIAVQGDNHASRLVHQWNTLSLYAASIEDKVGLCVLIGRQGENALNALNYQYDLTQLQPREPLEAYLAFLKGLVKKLFLEPQGISLDLDKLSQPDIPLEEKVRIAKEVAKLGELPAIFIANHPHLLADLELAEIIVKQGKDALTELITHLPALELKKHPVQERLALLKVIFAQESPLFYEEAVMKLIEESVGPDDAIESLIQLTICLKEGNWNGNLNLIKRKCQEAIYKHVPPEGASAALLKELIQKNGQYAEVILEHFTYFKCQAPKPEIFELVPVIMRQGEMATILLSYHLEYFFSHEIPLALRLETIRLMLKTNPTTGRGLARQLKSLGMAEADSATRFQFLKDLIQMGDAVAREVTFSIESMLEGFTPQERLELAFLLAHQGKDSAVALARQLSEFRLTEAPAADLYRLAELLVNQSEWAAREIEQKPDSLNIQAFSVEQCVNLVLLMIRKSDAYLTIDPEKFKLIQASGKERLEVAKSLLAKTELAHNFVFTLPQWNFSDVPVPDRLQLVEMMTRTHAVSRPLVLIGGCLSLLGKEATTPHLMALMRIFARKSHLLAAEGLYYLTQNLDFSTSRQILLEFLIDSPINLKAVFTHAATQEIKPLLNLLTLKTLEVQDEVNRLGGLPDDARKAIVQLREFLESQDKLRVLLPFWNEISKQANPMIQFKLQRWLAYTAGLFFDLEPKQIEAIEKTTILETIYQHQSLQDRFLFVRTLCAFNPFQTGTGRNAYGKLAWIFLAKLHSLGAPKEKVQKLEALIDGRSRFKETRRLSEVVDLFNELTSLPVLTIEEINSFASRLEVVLSLKTMDEVTGQIQTLTNILSLLGRSAFFMALLLDDLDRFFLGEIKERLLIGEIPDFSRKLQMTFGSSRNPNALFTYLRSIEQLPDEEREHTLRMLGNYMQAVLNDQFPAVRYQHENDPHLQQVFADAMIKSAWMEREDPVMVGNYQISISDDFIDLLLIGTEVQGSCLNINLDPHNNKCLVFIMMHGGILPIVAKDAQGKIAARSLLRLGWDKKNGKPLILQERIYSNVHDPNLVQKINEIALKKAQKMGIPLLAKREPGSQGGMYPGSFSYLGGDFPYVYSDAAGGVMDGIQGFDIEECTLLQA